MTKSKGPGKPRKRKPAGGVATGEPPAAPAPEPAGPPAATIATTTPAADSKPTDDVSPRPPAEPGPPAEAPTAATPIATADPQLPPESNEPAPDFPLAFETISVAVVVPVPMPPVLPSPAQAALEAARIVSEMVDIDSESGAVIAAAAAAGAAIEAAVAAQKLVALESPPATHGGHDPLTTVRLSRDRILRALSDETEVAAGRAEPGARSERARTDPGRLRARTEPGAEPGDDSLEDFDPVAIAAAAITRLRVRARTDLAELRSQSARHDVLVVVLAFVIIVCAGRIHARLVTPPTAVFSEHGLTFEHAAGWLGPEVVAPSPPRLVHDAIDGGAPAKDDPIYHVELTSTGSAKIDVLVGKKPAWSNIVTGLELDRRTRWGELYASESSETRQIEAEKPAETHNWLRTVYRYAHTAEKGDVPRVDRAIEYATIDRDQIYVVTLFGTPAELDQVEAVVAPSLRVQSQTALPLLPTSRLSQRLYPEPVGRAFESAVMVVVADLIDGRLKARGGGSGVIVGGDGSILTNYHVIHDRDGRLHDVFVIARFGAVDSAPQLQCAGHPNRGKLARDRDLALLKCDMDLDGRTWNPAASGVWATLPEASKSEIKMGQRLWVLGYPDVGGGGLTLSEGEVEGWTGEDGATGKSFLKTDASIKNGNSGGPVVDDQGRLVGIASAFRNKIAANGSVIEIAQTGLVRPLQSASDLLSIAAAGWTPREGYTNPELAPTAIEAAAEGVRIYTTVVDAANETPIRDATVMVLRPGINTSTIDMNRLDDQASAWGRTNAQGEVRLKQLVPVPGVYTVMVIAPGYVELIGDSELHLDANTPPSFDPWGKIGLRSR